MSATPEQIAIDESALEAAVEAMRVRLGPIVGTPEYIARHAERLKDQREEAARGHALTAITAYLSATSDAQAERVRVLEAEIAEMSKPEWFYDMLDGETGAADVESIINDMDMHGVMRVCGARQVWRKWVAHKCLTVDSDGDPDEVSYETFETPEEAERCWPESLAACRAYAALKAAP